MEGSSARPLANVSTTCDGDIGPGSRNAAHTVFDPASTLRLRDAGAPPSWELK